MGRRKNNTNDELKRYIESFVRDMNGGRIMATDLADYCNNVLHITPEVKYYHFTRDPEIKAMIDEINERIERRVFGPGGAVMIEDDCLLDNSRTDTSAIITEANDRIEKLSMANRQLAAENDKYKADIEALNTVADGLKKEAEMARIKSKESKEQRLVVRKLVEYIYAVAYTPVMQQHFVDLGLIDGEVDVPEDAQFLLDADSCDDKAANIKRYEDIITGETDGEEIVIPAEPGNTKPRVYSKAESQALSDLDSL